MKYIYLSPAEVSDIAIRIYSPEDNYEWALTGAITHYLNRKLHDGQILKGNVALMANGSARCAVGELDA